MKAPHSCQSKCKLKRGIHESKRIYEAKRKANKTDKTMIIDNFDI